MIIHFSFAPSWFITFVLFQNTTAIYTHLHTISIFNAIYCHPHCTVSIWLQTNLNELHWCWFERIFTELTNIDETLERWIKLTNIVERVPLFVPLVHQKGGQRKLISHIPHIPDLQEFNIFLANIPKRITHSVLLKNASWNRMIHMVFPLTFIIRLCFSDDVEKNPFASKVQTTPSPPSHSHSVPGLLNHRRPQLGPEPNVQGEAFCFWQRKKNSNAKFIFFMFLKLIILNSIYKHHVLQYV